MAAAKYITEADVSDNIVQGFDLSRYISEANDALESLALSLGADAADIESVRAEMDYSVIRYAIAFCLMRFCQDKMGTNNLDIPELEKYAVKYGAYVREISDLRKMISYEMITGNAELMRDRSITGGILFRS